MPFTEVSSFYAPQLDAFLNMLHFYLLTSCLHIFWTYVFLFLSHYFYLIFFLQNYNSVALAHADAIPIFCY